MSNLLTKRVREDLAWNFASFAVLAVSGLLLNILIARIYGAVALGVFMQVVSVYFVFSQLSVGGFMFSTLSFTGANAKDAKAISQIVYSGLLLTFALSSFWGLVYWNGRELLAQLFDSTDVAQGIAYTAPGLVFFALNKILLFCENGIGNLRWFAIGQALRYVFILLALFVLICFEAAGNMLPLVLTAGEMALFPILLCKFVRTYPFLANAGVRQHFTWCKPHLTFGTRGFFSGLLLDANSKVDIFLLGAFHSDLQVGVYSFAAMIAEGLFQIVIVIQTVLTPRLSLLKIEGRLAETKQLLRRTFFIVSPFLLVVTLIGWLLFSSMAELLTDSSDFSESAIVFAVLMVGISLSASHIAFSVALNQWGHPGGYTGFLLLIFVSNIVFNLLLMPRYGAVGAACGTALAQVLSVFYLRKIAWYVAKVKL